MPRKNPAIHDGLRRLRQRIVGMARGQPRSHACRPEVCVETWFDAQPRRRGQIRRRGQNRPDIRLRLPRLLRSQVLEVGARHLVHLKRKRKRRQLVQRRRQLINRIVRPGKRAMPSAIGGRDLEVGVDLLRSLHVRHHRPPVVQFYPARVGIDHVSRVHQLAMLPHQPLRPVELATLFIRRERQNQVALRLVPLPVQPQKRLHQRGVGVLHVLRPPAVVVAILLDKLEWIGRPIGAQSLHDIHVAQKQHRLLGWGSTRAEAYHQILLARIRPQQMHIGSRKSSVEKSLLHGRGRRRHVAQRRIRRVDLNQLLEDRPSLRAILRGGRRQ